ncbi:hypothetical protein D9M71_675090 [compost metagenome]
MQRLEFNLQWLHLGHVLTLLLLALFVAGLLVVLQGEPSTLMLPFQRTDPLFAALQAASLVALHLLQSRRIDLRQLA